MTTEKHNGSVRPLAGHSPQLGERVFVDGSAVVIGEVSIGDDSSVWPQAVIRGDMHSINIGKRCSIQDGSVLHVTHAGPYTPDGWPVIIGDDVIVGHRAVLHGCTIHDEVLIGNGAIVMDGATIEKQVVVAANALVAPGKTLESGFLYVGSPAKQARPLTDDEISFFTYSCNNYVKLKKKYLDLE